MKVRVEVKLLIRSAQICGNFIENHLSGVHRAFQLRGVVWLGPALNSDFRECIQSGWEGWRWEGDQRSKWDAVLILRREQTSKEGKGGLEENVTEQTSA